MSRISNDFERMWRRGTPPILSTSYPFHTCPDYPHNPLKQPDLLENLFPYFPLQSRIKSDISVGINVGKGLWLSLQQQKSRR